MTGATTAAKAAALSAATDVAETIATTVREAGRDAGTTVRANVRDAGTTVRENVREAGSTARGAGGHVIEQVIDLALDQADRVLDQADHLLGQAKSEVRTQRPSKRRPALWIGVALAVAAGITVALKLRPRPAKVPSIQRPSTGPNRTADRGERAASDEAIDLTPPPYLGADNGVSGGLLGGTSPGRVG